MYYNIIFNYFFIVSNIKIMSFRYSNKSDFDDMHVMHQTKSQFKNPKPDLHKIQNQRRSAFIDSFTTDSIITPATFCPPGVNSTKNFPCITTSDQKNDTGIDYTDDVNSLNDLKRKQAVNRKMSYFRSIVD